MLHHAETHLSCFTKDYENKTRYLHIVIPPEYDLVKQMAKEREYILSQKVERSLILPFQGKSFNVVLPEGYSIVDGNQTPDFFSPIRICFPLTIHFQQRKLVKVDFVI